MEGANCADLPGFVVDKYFTGNVRREPQRTEVALAICGNCIVQTACRDQALNMPGLQRTGVIGGVTAAEIRRARAWRNYELGFGPQPPYDSRRPAWLERPEAADQVEHAQLLADPDEPNDEPTIEIASPPPVEW